MSLDPGWPVRPLAELVDILDARRIPVKADERAARGGTVPYYGATGRAGTIDTAIFDEPLVLLGEDGAPFLDRYKPKAYLIDGPAWVNNHAHVLRPGPLLNRKFLRYYLDYFDYRGYANGTTRLKLTQAAMKGIPVRVPDLDVQDRIVGVLEEHLSRLEAAEACILTGKRRLASLRERLITEAVTGAHIPGPRIPTGLPEQGTRDGELCLLPAGWRWARLGEVADVVGGVTKDSKRQSNPDYVEVPYLRVANVQRGALRLHNVTRIRVSKEKAEALALRTGDVLLNEGGDRDKLARGWVWEGQIERCIHQNHVFRARVLGDLDPYFLSWTANTLGGRWAEQNGKQSVNLASISLSMIRKMPVVVPPKGVSHDIASELHQRLSAINALTKNLERASRRAQGLRRALLEAAFAGKLGRRDVGVSLLDPPMSEWSRP